MYCKECGAQLHHKAVVCVRCGCAVHNGYNRNNTFGRRMSDDPNISQYNGLLTLLLAIFVGYLGVHSFYTGKIGIGIAQLFTVGGCGIWVLVDIIMLATESFHDGEGKLVQI